MWCAWGSHLMVYVWSLLCIMVVTLLHQAATACHSHHGHSLPCSLARMRAGLINSTQGLCNNGEIFNLNTTALLLYLPLQKCCIRFAHIVGNILHAICMYATYYLMSICICANYKKLTKNWAYARNMCSTKYIFFAYMQSMCRIQSMQNVCILHTCIVHACCICALCI